MMLTDWLLDGTGTEQGPFFNLDLALSAGGEEGVPLPFLIFLHECAKLNGTEDAFLLSQVKSDADINDGPNWAPLLANCGLLLMACAQCLLTIVSSFRCYRQVCPCARQRDKKRPSAKWPLPDSPEPTGSFYSTSSKEMLISNWLGQQHRQNMLLITQPPVSQSLRLKSTAQIT
jgi:hypothetical protein